VADAEGVDAVTMRRVAEELGAGTMTLYHYVRSKDELIVIVIDRMMGELVVPEGEMPDNWRDAFAAIARRSRATFRAHGWLHEQMAKVRPQDAQIGKNGLRHFDQSLQAAAMTGLPMADQLELISFLDDFVFGYSIREREEPLGQITEETEPIIEAISDYIAEQVKTGEFPFVAAMLAGRSPRTVFEEALRAMTAEERFERGLERVLDGIALEIERRG
jgi:AcrR family transcriptional regulator